MSTKQSLLQVLGSEQKITRDQAMQAVKRQKETGEPLEKVLVELGAPEIDVYAAHAEMNQIPFANLKETKVDPDARAILPDSMQERHGAYPVRLDDDKLTVAMLDPKNFFAVDEMRMKTGKTINPVMVPPSQYDALKNNNMAAFSNGNGNGDSDGLSEVAKDSSDFDDTIGSMLDMLKPVEKDPDKKAKEQSSLAKTLDDDDGSIEENVLMGEGEMGEVGDSAQLADEAPIIRIVNTILMYAIKDGASDIHIEPQSAKACACVIASTAFCTSR